MKGYTKMSQDDQGFDPRWLLSQRFHGRALIIPIPSPALSPNWIPLFLEKLCNDFSLADLWKIFWGEFPQNIYKSDAALLFW